MSQTLFENAALLDVRAGELRPGTSVLGVPMGFGTELLGEITPGACAALLVVDGNPLDDLSVLGGQGKHLAAVVKAGRFYVDRL